MERGVHLKDLEGKAGDQACMHAYYETDRSIATVLL